MREGVVYENHGSDNNNWLLNAYDVHLALRDLHVLWIHLNLTGALWVGTIIILILQMKKIVHRTVKVLTKFTQIAGIQTHAIWFHAVISTST